MSLFSKINKSVQSNLGREPRRGAVGHVRRKVPIGYNGAPQIRPKSTPSRGPISKPHYLFHPWSRPTYDAKRMPDPTDHPRESLTTIGRCAQRATRPNKQA